MLWGIFCFFFFFFQYAVCRLLRCNFIGGITADGGLWQKNISRRTWDRTRCSCVVTGQSCSVVTCFLYFSWRRQSTDKLNLFLLVWRYHCTNNTWVYLEFVRFSILVFDEWSTTMSKFDWMAIMIFFYVSYVWRLKLFLSGSHECYE